MPVPPEPLSVLSIEDNPGDARLLEIRLREAFPDRPIRFRNVGEPGAALEALGRGDVDVAFLDYALDGAVTGLDVLVPIRSSGYEGLVVVVTGYDSDELAAELALAGADGHLLKQHLSAATVAQALRNAATQRHRRQAYETAQRELATRAAVAQMRRAERLASLGTLSAGRHARRCGEIVRNTLAFARREGRERAPVDLADAVRDAAELTRSYARKAGVAIELDLARDLPTIEANRTDLEQVVVNLVQNAIQAAAGDVRVVVRTTAIPDGVRIEVEDDGPGIPEHVKERIFDPFFTMRRHAGGTGLGTTFRIALPCGAACRAVPPPVVEGARAPGSVVEAPA